MEKLLKRTEDTTVTNSDKIIDYIFDTKSTAPEIAEIKNDGLIKTEKDDFIGINRNGFITEKEELKTEEIKKGGSIEIYIPPRTKAPSKASPKKRRKAFKKRATFKEKLLLQFTVSGIILAGALVLKMVKTDTTGHLTEQLSSTVSYNIPEAELKTKSNAVLNYITNFGDTVKSVFGLGENDNPETVDTFNIIDTATENAVNVDVNIETQTIQQNHTGERIDEEILEELNSRQDFYNVK